MQAFMIAILLIAFGGGSAQNEKTNKIPWVVQNLPIESLSSNNNDFKGIRTVPHFPKKGDLDRNVLRILPKGWDPKKVQMSYELLIYRVNPPRFFPLVGNARLVELQFKCTIINGQAREHVYLDFDHLVLSNSP